ncbi:hypothetical protein D3C85_1839150 [compost metagenome]
MPRLVIRKAFVLVRPDGEMERLETSEQMESALAQCQLSPDEYQIEQVDLMELQP